MFRNRTAVILLAAVLLLETVLPAAWAGYFPDPPAREDAPLTLGKAPYDLFTPWPEGSEEQTANQEWLKKTAVEGALLDPHWSKFGREWYEEILSDDRIVFVDDRAFLEDRGLKGYAWAFDWENRPGAMMLTVSVHFSSEEDMILLTMHEIGHAISPWIGVFEEGFCDRFQRDVSRSYGLPYMYNEGDVPHYTFLADQNDAFIELCGEDWFVETIQKAHEIRNSGGGYTAALPEFERRFNQAQNVITWKEYRSAAQTVYDNGFQGINETDSKILSGYIRYLADHSNFDAKDPNLILIRTYFRGGGQDRPQALGHDTAPALDTADGWALDGIQQAYQKGFIPADIQNHYTGNTTRAEFCRMAVKWVEYATGRKIDAVLADKGAARDPDAFTDANHADILAAYALGITGGTGPGTFSPNGPITREQAATMIRNTCRVIGMDTDGPPPSGFADLSAASGWAVDAINFCRANGVMSGTGGGRFSPKELYTRQQSIVTLNNIIPPPFSP